MSYAQIRELLSRHQAYDKKEKTDVEHITFLLDQHDNLLTRECKVAHITGSAIVVNATSRHILLIKHRKLGRWLQPGGHGDGESDPACIALRETSEETGLANLRFFPPNTPPIPIDIDVHTIPARRDAPEHKHLDFRYLMTTNSPDSLFENKIEILDAKWFTYDEAISLKMDPQLRRLIKKAYECCC